MINEITTIIPILNEIKNDSGKILASQFVNIYGYQSVNASLFNPWRAKLLSVIDAYNIQIPEIRERIATIGAKHVGPGSVNELTGYIDTIINLINKGLLKYGDAEKKSSDTDTIIMNKDIELALIFDRFHKVARQLRSRHDNRETLQIKDEYDVQDLLHALLLVHFDDVRPEERTPSYAGSSLRMDFLLKDYQTVIEVKKTRPSMTAKDLGEELIIDIEKYKAHPDCKTLYCFVYDPEGHLGNPEGIKKDLEAAHKDFVKVFIRPE